MVMVEGEGVMLCDGDGWMELILDGGGGGRWMAVDGWMANCGGKKIVAGRKLWRRFWWWV